MLGAEVARRDRAGGDEHALALPAAQHVERDQGRAVVGAHLEQRAVGQRVDPPRRPHRSRHRRSQHLLLPFDLDPQRARLLARQGREDRARPEHEPAAGLRRLVDRALRDRAALDPRSTPPAPPRGSVKRSRRRGSPRRRQREPRRGRRSDRRRGRRPASGASRREPVRGRRRRPIVTRSPRRPPAARPRRRAEHGGHRRRRDLRRRRAVAVRPGQRLGQQLAEDLARASRSLMRPPPAPRSRPRTPRARRTPRR